MSGTLQQGASPLTLRGKSLSSRFGNSPALSRQAPPCCPYPPLHGRTSLSAFVPPPKAPPYGGISPGPSAMGCTHRGSAVTPEQGNCRDKPTPGLNPPGVKWRKAMDEPVALTLVFGHWELLPSLAQSLTWCWGAEATRGDQDMLDLGGWCWDQFPCSTTSYTSGAQRQMLSGRSRPFPLQCDPALAPPGWDSSNRAQGVSKHFSQGSRVPKWQQERRSGVKAGLSRLQNKFGQGQSGGEGCCSPHILLQPCLPFAQSPTAVGWQGPSKVTWSHSAAASRVIPGAAGQGAR